LVRQNCQHRLDWFHIARRLEKIRKQLLYLPATLEDFGRHLAFHSRNLDSIKHQLWNDGIETAEYGMTAFRIGLFQHAWNQPKENKTHFQIIESQLDELRSYLYAHHEAVRGYARTFRSGERVSTANVESTVNQLISRRFCKKQQMSWTRAGAQGLLHVKTAVLNGVLHGYTGHREQSHNAA
jgi:hypothetical protein